MAVLLGGEVGGGQLARRAYKGQQRRERAAAVRAGDEGVALQVGRAGARLGVLCARMQPAPIRDTHMQQPIWRDGHGLFGMGVLLGQSNAQRMMVYDLSPGAAAWHIYAAYLCSLTG